MNKLIKKIATASLIIVSMLFILNFIGIIFIGIELQKFILAAANGQQQSFTSLLSEILMSMGIIYVIIIPLETSLIVLIIILLTSNIKTVHKVLIGLGILITLLALVGLIVLLIDINKEAKICAQNTQNCENNKMSS
ncbi:Hypothetical protein, predicted transmembrane protein [Mycoplasmopsis bovigenitalium 51080]|uniref:Uncharacterized protein n=1 Tax=Mycoplasmopsis bovigenitalium 51080 TaxID=1188235 RepID=N9TVW4_9BACT|nr:hypothetical protein [Mycoplasmopsis bovigenitalium]ENY70254.1 Hypothetical protein, predicted transmembrane protein [Mycoplasmopsis bovigenitalium 51080]